MALVYEAEQLPLGRRVALKLISPDAAADAAYRERFLRETHAAMELEHPNVVPVYDAGEADGELFIAMRLIEGEDLRQIIQRQRRLPPERALAILGQIAGGLDAAHARGLVHGDVKPANVMVQQLGDAREHCWVVDFGLAAELDARSLHSTGTWTGTPAYVSPEQLRGERVDARTDVYALGVLAFHALAGRAPYVREHDAGTLLAHLHATPPSLCELCPELPRDVDAVIARALAKAPEARFASAGALADALAQAIGGGAPALATGGPVGGVRTRGPLGNLPAEVSSFIGRREELDALRRALAHARLLTVIGPGGVGKTTLALHLAASVADEYAGAWVVELDGVQDAAGLELALARALELRVWTPDSIRASLLEFFEGRRMLLVLDNCEHMIAEVGALSTALLAAAPRLAIVATSREPLAIAGERAHLLAPLQVPVEDDEPADVIASDSARLLLQRAAEQGIDVRLEAATVHAIARICTRLEGIPLAIELAAARLRTLSVSDLDRRLQDDLRVLSDGGGARAERQRTLDGLIEWSWRLLEAGEQAVLSRLAVFAGTFTLDAAEAVAAGQDEQTVLAPAVVALADKSMLHVDAREAETRLRMLAPVREFALARLVAAGQRSSARAAHRRHYLALAERARPLLDSEHASEWLARLEPDQANLRAAIESVIHEGEVEEALRLAVAMRQFWACRGLAGEGIELLTATLDAAGEAAEPRLLARAHGAAAHLAAGMLGDARRAEPHARQALRIARSIGDADAAAEALTCLSWSESFAGRAAQGLERADEGLASAGSIESPVVLGRLLDARGLALEELGDVPAARGAYARARQVFAEAGYPLGLALVTNHVGNLELGAGEPAAAAAHFSLARVTAERAADGASVAMATLNLALVDLVEGRREQARELFVDALLTNQAHGDQANIAFSIFGLALTEPDPVRAAELHGSAAHRLAQLEMGLSTLEERLRSQETERLCAELGRERFDREGERGRRLRVEDIARAVLGDEEP